MEPVGDLQPCSSRHEEEVRPSKKRRVGDRKLYKKGGTKLVGGDREERKKPEDMKQKLRRKFGSAYNIKPWRRAVEQSIYPESSSDEEQGWTVPGDYLRTLFDLPAGYLADDSDRTDLPTGVHQREDGSFLWNDENDV